MAGALRRSFNFVRHSSIVVFEDLVLSNRISLSLIKPLLMPGGWHEVMCKYLRVSVGLSVVRFDVQDRFF